MGELIVEKSSDQRALTLASTRIGVRVTTAYSACTVCSPTPAALLTGQSPARLHITDWIAGHVRPFAKLSVPDWQMYLAPGTPTRAAANNWIEAGRSTDGTGSPDASGDCRCAHVERAANAIDCINDVRGAVEPAEPHRREAVDLREGAAHHDILAGRNQFDAGLSQVLLHDDRILATAGR